MAKIRVYELARELSMTNKDLLEKIEGMDLPDSASIKTHTSSIEEETVELIKANLAAPKQANIIEKRIGKTLIRRRRKDAPAEPAPEKDDLPQEAAPEAQAAPEDEDELVEAKAVTKAEAEPGAKKAEKAKKEAVEPQEVLEEEASDQKALQEEPVSAPDAKALPEAEAVADAQKETPAPKAVKKRKKAIEETPAKIVAKPTPPPPPEPEPEPTVESAQAPPIHDQEPAAQAGEDEQVQAVLPKEVEPEKAGIEEQPEPQTPLETEVKEAQKPAKPKKKKKKEQAAKIISLPEKLPEFYKPEPRQDSRQEAKPEPRPERGPATPDSVESETALAARKKKKKGRKVEDAAAEVDAKLVKKRASFKRREVVEGAALYDQAGRGRKGKRGGGKPLPKPGKTITTTPKAIKRRIKVDEAILLSELAKRMGIKASELIRRMMDMGTMATINQSLDFETATILATEFGYELERAGFEEETLIKTQQDAPESLKERPPVVTIMGHVDHGKTSLLDVIRKTSVTSGEAGGITQHIGAYMVATPKGNVTFLDTPGHEAFTAMRARGASVTDIVVLVVAADDGVMPQTVEAINHARAAQVPIIVAVNKMDKPGADPDKVMRELAEKGLSPEDWGGDTIFVKVSAKANTGIDLLLEMILLQAEVLELTANADKPARGHVVEGKMDPGRGPVATVLVKEGTLHAGEVVVCGVHWGKIRALTNDRGHTVEAAGPSFPAEIIGLSGVPMAGDEMVVVENEKSAKQISEHRSQKQRIADLAKTTRPNLENIFAQMQMGQIKQLEIIVKADVQGSVEALVDSLNKLSGDEVKISVLHAAVGTVTESDVGLAAVSGAIILAFNVRPNPKVVDFATEEHVDIRYYDIIYDVINDIKAAMVGMMASTYKEHIVGRAEVRDTFTIPKVGTIAGSYILDGKAQRGSLARLVRDGVVVHDGKVGSLRRFKDDVKEVLAGYECGIGFDNFNDIKAGDHIELYKLEEIKPTMD